MGNFIQNFLSSRNTTISLQASCPLAFFGMVFFILYTREHPINQMTTREVSRVYKNYFDPATYTFGVWGVILLLLLAYCFFQLKKPPLHWQLRSGLLTASFANQIRLCFLAGCFLNPLWLIAWHNFRIECSMLISICMFLSLFWINKITHRTHLTMENRLFVELPFSIYFGWSTFTLLANLTSFFTATPLPWFNADTWFWTVVLLVFGSFLATFLLFYLRSPAYCLTVIWGYIGIFANYFNPSTPNTIHYSIMLAAIICTVFLSGATLFASLVGHAKGFAGYNPYSHP